MNDTTTPRHPKRKRQPTAECMRQQLALAADEIIRLRTEQDEICAILRGDRDHMLNIPKPWWRRMLGRWFV